ncbi:hypothetical protein LS70_008890 [Helicobacter sp. MIT 11-5569]|uniref:hypothetical protein n=1 Tax=Helicobacter sp. MIT 11-5569 TaxID=1548151 RepID=UPI00068BBB81|nr:hypothetical protein [Helicobacter sp. MIT 11-5569]TLD80676.1 hypothetical protein LS70_008890 [Helicobacter sp. MIT 11-5569]
MSYKKYLLLVFVIPLFVLIPLGILLYIYDPFQIYHKPYFRETTFFNDMRMQDRGIIDHYEFDSFILGSSMFMGTSSTEATEKLGDNWINISLNGSRFNERAVILDYLFRHKKPKSILYTIDGLMLLSTLELDTTKFSYLYDDNPFNDFKTYFNAEFLLCALTFSHKKECVGEYTDIHRLTSLENSPETFKLFGGFQNWIQYHNDPRIKDIVNALSQIDALPPFQPINQTFDISPIANHINAHFIRFVQDNPQTQFHIIIPTYSRLSYRLAPPQNFYAWAQIMSWLIPYCEQFDNIKFYGFDHLDYADNIANYNDLYHYYHNLNSFHLDAIAQNAFILNAQNIVPYLRLMEQKIIQYDATPLFDMLKAAKAQNK